VEYIGDGTSVCPITDPVIVDCVPAAVDVPSAAVDDWGISVIDEDFAASDTHKDCHSTRSLSYDLTHMVSHAVLAGIACSSSSCREMASPYQFST
jgi:hypothetical protein